MRRYMASKNRLSRRESSREAGERAKTRLRRWRNISPSVGYAAITYPAKELVLFGLGALPLLLLLALPVIRRMLRIYPSVLFKEI